MKQDKSVWNKNVCAAAPIHSLAMLPQLICVALKPWTHKFQHKAEAKEDQYEVLKKMLRRCIHKKYPICERFSDSQEHLIQCQDLHNIYSIGQEIKYSQIYMEPFRNKNPEVYETYLSMVDNIPGDTYSRPGQVVKLILVLPHNFLNAPMYEDLS